MRCVAILFIYSLRSDESLLVRAWQLNVLTLVCVPGASEVGTTCATTSMPVGLEVPKECSVRQTPMTLQRAAEARGVNTLMREPHVATRASELLDYAGWAHPMAAADVLAGDTTEKRR